MSTGPSYSETISDSDTPLTAAVRDGLDAPLVLWGHPGVDRLQSVKAAAMQADRAFHHLKATDMEGWDGFRDVSESGHFRQVSIEKFLETGERADPNSFTVEPGAVLFIEGLNRITTRLAETVFEQLLEDSMLLNNPVPSDARIIASADPPDRESALNLLGPVLREAWNATRNRTELRYSVFDLPELIAERCHHWAVLPSVRRFSVLSRQQKLAEEVIWFLEQIEKEDPDRALTTLYAALLREVEPFEQLSSPRAFRDLGALLAERQLFFSSHTVKEAIATAEDSRSFQAWLHDKIQSWNPDSWIGADAPMTVAGAPATGSAWLRHIQLGVAAGEISLDIGELPTYSTFERGSLDAWATQELGDELGADLVSATLVTRSDVERLR